MLLEGVGIYSLVRFAGSGPATAEAAAAGAEADNDEATELPADDLAELEVVDCRPTNKTIGKLITFHIRVSILVRREDHEMMTKLVEEKQNRLQDRVNFVVRSAELKHLNEPGLDTIKRQIKHEFDLVFGDDKIVVEVLIPELLQSGPGV